MKVVDHLVLSIEQAMLFMSLLWCGRKRFLFQAVPLNDDAIVLKVLSLCSYGIQSNSLCRGRIIRFSEQTVDETVGFFDGVALNGECGVGMVIKMAGNICFQLYMKVGKGSNNRAELLALWGLLHFASLRGIVLQHIMGDSKVIID